jgi:hypothetical protein
MNNHPPATQRILLFLLAALILANVVYLLFVGWPMMRAEGPKPEAQAATGAPSLTPSISAVMATATATPPNSGEVNSSASDDGLFFFSLSDGVDEHFFIFHPQTQSLQRITSQTGEDRDPALSPED